MPAGAAAPCPRPRVHGGGLCPMVLQPEVLMQAMNSVRATNPITAPGPICAMPTNHKQSLMINSVCSLSVPVRTEQLASACDDDLDDFYVTQKHLSGKKILFFNTILKQVE